jgi:hypothetical protein
VSMIPPDGGYRPGQHRPPVDDPLAAAARREEAERVLAMRRHIDAVAARRRWTRRFMLLGLVVLAGWAAWRFMPREATHPTIAWDRHVGGDTKITGPSIGVSPNGKWFALAWAEGSQVWYLRGSRELSGKLRLDSPIALADKTHPFAAFDEDPPKAAIDNDGQIAVAWMTRPLSQDDGSVIAVARPNLERDGGVAVTRIEGDDAGGFLLCESLDYDDDGGLVAAWIDGGRPAPGEKGKLVCAVAPPQGGFESVTTLADSACSCCRTSLAWLGPETFAVAYRGVDNGNVRDIRFGVLSDEGLDGAGPTLTGDSHGVVRNDGWALDGCPSEGPTVAAEGTNAAWVTWYTEGEPRGLRLARITPTRTERGLRWEPVNVYMVDDRKEAQHPSLATLSSGRPFVVFEGPTPEGGRALYARVMGRKGLSEPVRFTTATRASRPVPARWGTNGALIGWTESDEMGPRIALAEWKGL